jgi:hypothetical protein
VTPDPDALPFLVVHGDWFVVVIAAVATVVAFVAFVGLRRIWWNVKRHRLVAKLRRASAIVLAEGDVVIGGRWRDGGVVIGNQHVEVTDHARIADGRLVVVVGTLSRGATDDPAAGYRDGGVVWRLDRGKVFDANDYFPRPTLHAQSWFAAAVGSMFIALLGMKCASHTFVLRYNPPEDSPITLDELDGIAIAAALPGREDVLDKLEDELSSHPLRDDRSVRRRLALAALIRGACNPTAVDVFADAWRLEEALANARRCGYDRTVSLLVVATGDFRAARELPVHDDMQVWLDIATGEWSSAAASVERVVGRRHLSADADVVDLRCLARWFEHLARDPTVDRPDRLSAIETVVDAPACAAAVAATSPDPRVALAGAIAKHVARAPAFHERNDRLAIETLALLHGLDVPYDDREVLGAIGDGRPTVGAWLLAAHVERARAANQPRGLLAALGGVAMREVHRGDFAAARRAADEALAIARTGGDAGDLERAENLARVIALREGAEVLPPSEGSRALAVRALDARLGIPPPARELHRCAFRDSAEALDAARGGDAIPLVRTLQRCDFEASVALPRLLGIAPLVKVGRAELVAMLRWWGGGVDYGNDPFASVAYVAMRRDIARMLGDDASAATFGAIAERIVAVLDDPDRALALAIWID